MGPCTDLLTWCHQLHGQHHRCFLSKLGLNPSRKWEDHSQALHWAPQCPAVLQAPAIRIKQQGRRFSAFLPVFHTNLRLCAKICAVGRLPGCSATAFVLSRAWGGGQLPASISERERGQHLEKAIYMEEPALLSETG